MPDKGSQFDSFKKSGLVMLVVEAIFKTSRTIWSTEDLATDFTPPISYSEAEGWAKIRKSIATNKNNVEKNEKRKLSLFN